MKTIFKLHENGDFETVDTALIQSGITGNYSFNENSITVPKIIEYPPLGYRNYFVEKTSLAGWISIDDGLLGVQDDSDRSTDFISVLGGMSYTIRVRYKNLQSNDSRAWVTGYYYNAQREFISTSLDDYSVPQGASGEYEFVFTLKPPSTISFIRYSFNLYDHPRVELKVSIESTTMQMSTEKHYLAFEDMPEWVIDTGNPVSIFPQGIVIKGEITQS